MLEKILPFTRKRYVAGLKCAFTGHRPQNLPFRFDETDERCLRLKAELRKLIVQMIEQKNVTHFISGMALGIDTYAAEMVLDLKTDFPFTREVLSFAPKFRLKRYMGKGFLDLPFCSPACSSMLSIAHSFGFDIVQRTLPGEMCGCSDEQEAQTTDNNKNNLSRHIFLLLI